jgi:chorismate mutase
VPFIIAGPCAAESKEQVNDLAALISSLNIKVFRAGIWKPRTRPNQFEGLGTTALSWLAEVQKTYSLEAIIEVANARHVEEMNRFFISKDPQIEDYWRGIILFGRNVASYN